MSDQTNFKALEVTEPQMPGDAKKAQARPEGSRRGRDMYEGPSKTSRNSDSKSFPRKNGK